MGEFNRTDEKFGLLHTGQIHIQFECCNLEKENVSDQRSLCASTHRRRCNISHPVPADFFFTCYARELVGWKGSVSLVGIWQGTRTRVGLNVTRLSNKNECHVEQDASGPKLALGLPCPMRRRIGQSHW